MPHINVRTKLVINLLFSTLWMALSIWLYITWYEKLSSHVGEAVALFLIGSIAIVSGFMNAFLRVALVLDKRPSVPPLK